MKKLIVYVLALALLVPLSISAFAGECAHSYTTEHFSADCVSPARTVYTCALCGDSYTTRDDSFTEPDGFWMLLSGNSEKGSGTLSVTLSIGNNPGVWGYHVQIPYNNKALKVVSMENGTAFDKSIVRGMVDKSTYINYYAENYLDEDVFENGTVLTVNFEIIDDSQPYGVSLTCGNYWVVSYSYLPNDPVYGLPMQFTPVNLVGLGELGEHSYVTTTVPPTCTLEGYTEHTCSVCADSYRTDTTAATGHDFVRTSVITPAGHGTEGLAECICTACGATKTEIIPALPLRLLGDIYYDGILNGKDGNILQQILSGDFDVTDADQFYAADVFTDGILNGKDANILTMALCGDYCLNPGED